MKIPFSTIKIGCQEYKVKEEDYDYMDVSNTKGTCSFNCLVLRFINFAGNISHSILIFLHEIWHADFDYYGIKLPSAEDLAQLDEPLPFQISTMEDVIEACSKSEWTRIRQNIEYYEFLIKIAKVLGKERK